MPNSNSNAIDERRAGLIRGLRELADFLETHPGVLTPVPTSFNAFAHTRDEIATQARLTTWEKRWSDSWLSLTKEFAGEIRLEINTERENVCRRVVTGTRIVPASPETTIEIAEWICEEPSLLAGAQ